MTFGGQRIAIITGGSRGSGRETVLQPARKGVTSLLTYNTHPEEAERVVADAEALGGKAFALKLDVSDVSSFPDFVGEVRAVLEKLGTARFNYLINNAGIGIHKPYESVTEDDLDKLIAVHI